MTPAPQPRPRLSPRRPWWRQPRHCSPRRRSGNINHQQPPTQAGPREALAESPISDGGEAPVLRRGCRGAGIQHHRIAVRQSRCRDAFVLVVGGDVRHQLLAGRGIADPEGPEFVADLVARPLLDGGSVGGPAAGVKAETAGPVDSRWTLLEDGPMSDRPLLSDAAVAGLLNDRGPLVEGPVDRLEALAALVALRAGRCRRLCWPGRRRDRQTGAGCYRRSEQQRDKSCDVAFQFLSWLIRGCRHTQDAPVTFQKSCNDKRRQASRTTAGFSGPSPRKGQPPDLSR